MNKRGFTVIELIVSFALTTLVVGLLFQMLLSLKEVYVASGFKSQMVNKQTLISSKINQDLNNKTLKIALKCGDNCLNFIFEDGTNKKLIVDDKNSIFSYGDYSTKLVNGSWFGDFYIRNEKIMGLDATSNYDSVIEIKIPIGHSLLEEDYGINMIYQYDSGTSSIADIIFDDSATTEDKIVFKGSSHMYHINNTTFTDPGYYVYRSNGTIEDMSVSVTKSGNVGSSVGTTYVLVYTLKDGSNNVIDIATREVTVVKGVYEYDYTGNYQTFLVPFDGTYQFEAWGAQGGIESSYISLAAKGAYAKGSIYLEKGTSIYVYVGENGKLGIPGVNATSTLGQGGSITFNGGAAGGTAGGSGTYPYANYRGGNSGGGATDFRLSSGTWNNTTGLRSRIMVSGGGGGAQSDLDLGLYDSENGFGGTTTSGKGGVAGYIIGREASYSANIPARGNGATQITGGAFGAGSSGANSGSATLCNGHSGGGGGYYGGFGAQSTGGNCFIMGGAGGSSFISGHPGVNSVNASGVHTNSTVHYSGYAFFNTSMIAGNASMPNPRAAGNITGNTVNGYAKVTVLSIIDKYNGDVTAPVITLNGAATVSYVAGTTTPYNDLGATAIDNIDGDVTANITVTSEVINTMGNHVITYTAMDANGNSSTVTRTVSVTQLQSEVLVVGGGGAGGMDMGGGGGGGGVVYKPSITLTTGTSHGAIVGAGGVGAPAGGTSGNPSYHMFIIEAKNGGNSTFGADTTWGSSSAKAGKSCYSLMLDGIKTSGVYWIDPDQGGTNTPFQVYCDMEYDGGGWTMLLKATTGTTFNYNSSYWTTNNTLNPTDLTLNNADAKYRSYNEMPVNDLMARWPDVNSDNYRWVENGFNSGAVQTPLNFFSTANLKFIGDAKNVDNWSQNIFSTQVDIRFYGFNFVNNKTYNTQANVRWGFGFNENGEGLYSSPATLNLGTAPGSDDVSGGIGMDSSYGNYSAGDYISCCQDTTGMNRAARVEMYGRNSSDTADTTTGIVALGGGAGGSSVYTYSPGAMGARGASGGGTSGYSNNGGTRAGGLSLSGQGNIGGQGGPAYYSGGGGGAGGAGTGSTGQPNGGAGVANSILGYTLYWGGGGGGASYSLATGGNGGIGGGGGGAVGTTTGGAGFNTGFAGGGGAPNAQTNTPGGNGGANTGGGGGGGAHYNINNNGGNGGSGIVIVKYYGPPKATGGTITSVGGYTIHTFTTSGTFIVN